MMEKKNSYLQMVLSLVSLAADSESQLEARISVILEG